MHSSLVVLALAATAAAQAVTQLIVPSSLPPAGCDNSRQGTFEITITNVTNTPPAASTSTGIKRSVELVPRQKSGVLTLTLVGGILKDQDNRTGYIASNYQFQFDGPPQAGAIYTGGFSLCANGSLALGGSDIFYQCLSGSFYNLYDRDWAEHCVAVYVQAIGGAGSVYSTSPPVPVSTGPSEATIANGGGTQSMNSTAAGIGAASTSGGAATSGATSTAGGAAATTGGSVTANTATASNTASSSSSAAGAAVAIATNVPQALVAWAMGIMGAIALV